MDTGSAASSGPEPDGAADPFGLAPAAFRLAADPFGLADGCAGSNQDADSGAGPAGASAAGPDAAAEAGAAPAGSSAANPGQEPAQTALPA